MDRESRLWERVSSVKGDFTFSSLLVSNFFRSFLPLSPPVNSESLEISFLHLVESKAILAYFLANSPASMLPILDEVAFDVILLYYPSYDRIHPEIHVRIADLPSKSNLRELRQANLNSLVRVGGVVTRRTGVFLN